MSFIGIFDRKLIGSVVLSNGWEMKFAKPLSVWDAVAEASKAEYELSRLARKPHQPEKLAVNCVPTEPAVLA